MYLQTDFVPLPYCNTQNKLLQIFPKNVLNIDTDDHSMYSTIPKTRVQYPIFMILFPYLGERTSVQLRLLPLSMRSCLSVHIT